MAGICGILGSQKDQLSFDLLTKMRDTILHRGPEKQDFYLKEGIALALNSLKVECTLNDDTLLKQSEAEKVLFLLDGHVTNLVHLEEDLTKNGYDNINRSSNGILIKLYKVYGINFIEKLNGSFAIALYDIEKKQLILARDRGGFKPLFYYIHGNILIFASELKAITCTPFFKKKIDQKGIYLFLAYGYLASPTTIYKNAYKLEDSEILTYRNNTITKRKYYKCFSEASPEIENRITERELILTFDNLLTQNIERYLGTQVGHSVGCFLSGGVDTSLIAAIIRKLTDKKLKTFILGFEDKICDERPYAKQVADHLGTDHYEYVLKEQDFFDTTQRIVDLFDEPFADISAIPTYLANRLAKKQVDCIFSGDGADFLFGNYDFKYLFLMYKIVPYLIRRMGLKVIDPVFNLSLVKKKFPNMPIKNYLGEASFYEAFFLMWKARELDRLLNYKLNIRDLKFYKIIHETANEPISNKILLAQFKTYGMDCVGTKMERTSMSNSLLALCPYLDNDIIDFADRIPLEFKFQKGYGKYLNRKLLYKYLPERYFRRPKRGFGLPFGKITNRGMKYYTKKYLNNNRLKNDGFFKDINLISNTVSCYFRGNYFIGPKLWALIIFEIWREKNFG